MIGLRSKFVIMLPLLLAGVGLSLFWTSSQAGEEVKIDGVIHVQNGDKPENGIETIQLKELWRAGGEDDEVFFGTIGQVLSDPDGNIYLLDSQLSEVHVYSPEGEFLKTVGGEGDGPGEVRNPSDIFFLPGGKMGIAQQFPGKVIMIDLDGNPAGSFLIGAGDPGEGNFSVLIRGRSTGDEVVLAGIHMTFQGQGVNNQTYFLSRIDSEGKELQRYLSKEYAVNFADFRLDEMGMHFAWGLYDISSDGKLFVAPHRNTYEIQQLNADGKLERIIERKYTSLKRNDKQTHAAELILEGVAQNYRVPVLGISVEDTEPDISSLQLTSNGELWIRTSRGDNDLPEGVLTVYDVFDPKGNYAKQIQLSAPGDASQDGVFLLDGGKVVVVTGILGAFLSQQGVSGGDELTEEEAHPLQVICYTM
ncbi:MAG: hypothetical protein KJ970_11435 [Candidatus Eisenbacteria bacterium]|uniref:6-bladed beta-propeller n=1 Tax=Eiseniibacteriota bacterium TaxID=2212470 RepID=A0A948RXQ8_UNCEI|nr:hypothetical protein [Candidatus Eisenbacteria bacterium]MBU1948573.1 hypothetical protein [Candidatus Eisenbacteria bacterium]MBU2691529.1 hypothetical protein [Candidatus Eisenbacteria bacterium]